MFSSAFLAWTEDETVFAGRSRDDRLFNIWVRYDSWCKATGGSAISLQNPLRLFEEFLMELVSADTFGFGTLFGLTPGNIL